jgi:Ca-activated chloride channel family protein
MYDYAYEKGIDSHQRRSKHMTRTNSLQSRNILAAGLALMIVAGAGIAQDQSTTQQASTTTDVQPAVERVNLITPQRPRVRGVITQIKAVDVSVRITDAIATTEMKIVVENHGSTTTQARLVLPVPDGATIGTFGIDGIGDEPTAELLPREEATRRYNEIVRSMTDPGLLEFVGSSMIQSSVFPVEPGGQRTMTIAYEQSLDAHSGRVEYVLPRSASLASNAVKWNIDIEVESSGVMGPVFSPSHPIVTKPVTDTLMRVGVPVLDEPGAFRLYAMLGSTNTATALLYPDEADDGSGYFMYVADAPEIDNSNLDGLADRIMREVTIVIDRSGSMGGEKIAQAQESAKQIVYGMSMGEYVRVIDYSSDVRSFSDSSVQLTPESVKQIVAYIDNIRSNGGTNLHGALMEALKATPATNTLPMVIFLTDGLATVGTTGESEIRKDAQNANTSNRRVFTFGVGYDVNAPLLDGLAIDTKAESTFVLPGEDVEMKVGQVFDKLDGPVMIDPYFGIWHADYGNQLPKLTMVEPRELGDLFAGSRVVVLGRYEGLSEGSSQIWVMPEDERMKMETIISGQRFWPGNFSVMFAEFSGEHESQQHAFVSRLWAQERINMLINEIRLAGADGSEPSQELVDEIVRLSLEHGIMTEYTAFLADETMGLADAASRESYGYARTQMDESNQQRSGQAAVSQSENRKNQDNQNASKFMGSIQGTESPYAGGKAQSTGNIASNQYWDDSMNQIRVQTVQRGLKGTMYRKSTQWVDPMLGEVADQEPEVVVEFDTEDYWMLIEDLVKQDRQWILSNRGEVYFLNHGKRVLVKNPE